jgi:prephenate dehydrogenase
MLMFERVTIVGVGLLGASLGMAIKKRKLAREVIGVGRAGSESLRIAKRRGAIDRGVEDVAAGVAGSDLVVLCTPVLMFPEMMKKMAGSLKAGAVVTDVGSTKAQVMAWAKRFLPRGSFVGSHPMAGSEKSGPGAAREDLYEGAVCLMCGEQKAKRVEAMWKAVGMKTVWMKAAAHDKVVAGISHLPHAAAFSLASTVGKWPESFVAAGGGFCDTTRIAGSDVAMWRDIFLTNREGVVRAIGAMEKELAGLKKAIARGSVKEIEKRLEKARATRAAVIAARNAR